MCAETGKIIKYEIKREQKENKYFVGRKQTQTLYSRTRVRSKRYRRVLNVEDVRNNKHLHR